MMKYPVAGTAPQDASTVKQDAAFVPSLVTFVGVPLAQAAVTGVGLALLAFLVVAGAIVLLDLHVTARAWVIAGIGALAIAVGVIVDQFPARRQEVLDGWYKRELAERRDINGDGYIGAKPARHNTRQDAAPETHKIQLEKTRLCAFVRTVETQATVRALHAAGWTDDRLNATYWNWLSTIVRLPDGRPAAEQYGKGQWRLTAPAAEIVAVIEADKGLLWLAQDGGPSLAAPYADA